MIGELSVRPERPGDEDGIEGGERCLRPGRRRGPGGTAARPGSARRLAGRGGRRQGRRSRRAEPGHHQRSSRWRPLAGAGAPGGRPQPAATGRRPSARGGGARRRRPRRQGRGVRAGRQPLLRRPRVRGGHRFGWRCTYDVPSAAFRVACWAARRRRTSPRWERSATTRRSTASDGRPRRGAAPWPVARRPCGCPTGSGGWLACSGGNTPTGSSGTGGARAPCGWHGARCGRPITSSRRTTAG